MAQHLSPPDCHSIMPSMARVGRHLGVILALLAAASSAQAADDAAGRDAGLCVAAIAQRERQADLPPLLLRAIGIVETGRPDPVTGRVVPWPWSLNIAGIDHVYATKSEAIAGVLAAQAAGIRSIDVGCMQVNLMFHPLAFATLDEALDPQANVAYAALFLHRLRGDLGSWPMAAAAYHSMSPPLANAYAARVAVHWQPARGFVMPGTVSEPVVVTPSVDPYDVMTPELQARVRAAAADRLALLARARPAVPAPPPARRTALIQEASIAATASRPWR
jgi:hypothetical protein